MARRKDVPAPFNPFGDRPAPSPKLCQFDPQDPDVDHNRRSSLPGQRIAGIGPDLHGGYRFDDPERPDTVLLGHPESASMFSTNYGNDSRTLDGDETTRLDLNYVSAEDIRKRQRGSEW